MRKKKEIVSVESSETVASMVRRLENSYIGGVTQHSKYVSMSMYENLCKIDAYLNSKHISGDTDSMGRDKPFFNIVTAAVNIWFRATDIDRKNINIKATRSTDILAVFLATIHLQDWMKEENFGAFLNDWGRSLARYGSSVLKFVPKGKKLCCMVVPWNRLIVDPVEFEPNLKIEVLELTEAQLQMNKVYNKTVVESLCDSVLARKTLDGTNKDNRNDYIKIYEVHGMLPLSHITEDPKDDDTMVQQMHVVSYVAKKENSDEYDEFTLYKGREKKDPYMITHLIKEDGQTLSIGAVQHLFEAQWMANHSVKLIKDQLDLASKLIFQTQDGNFVGQNALEAVETGDILVHEPNSPLSAIQNNSHDIASIQNYQAQWMNIAKEITSTPDSIAGNTMPSGTAYRQVAILNQESHSLFEIMTENKGLYVEQMLREFIVPFLKTQMDTNKEIAATLSEQNINMIDRIYVPGEAARRIQRKSIDALVKGQMPVGLDHAQEQEAVKNELSIGGNTRYFKPDELDEVTWRDQVLKGLEGRIECEITNETTDKEAELSTLNTMLQTIASNPAILQDETARMIFTKILIRAGQVSPIELPPRVTNTPAVQTTPQPMTTANAQMGT